MPANTTVNIINDLSTLTRVPYKILDDLNKKEALCIGSALYEAKLEQEEVVILNIGIGNLSIELNTGLCKFLPSRELKTIIKKCLTNGVDPLQIALEDSIREKLLNIYKAEV